MQATRYDIKDGNKIYAATVLAEDSFTKEGYCAYYDSAGRVKEDGYFSIGREHGEWKKYYTNTGKVWRTVKYNDGELTGKAFSYYGTGEVKREEEFVKSELKEGKCFNKDGSARPYTAFEQKAEFPGGEKAFTDFISRNLQYPKECQMDGYQGRIVLNFIIDTSGKITEADVQQSVHPCFVKEVVRVLARMPKWKPALIDDEPVKMIYTFPVTFALENDY